MKKTFLILPAILCSLIFSGCNLLETTGVISSSSVTFSDYKTFSKNKSSWTEPENYSFKYKYCIGDAVVNDYVTVTVVNGKSTVYYGDDPETNNETSEIYNPVDEDYRFESIKQIYEAFDKEYQERLAENSTTTTTTFEVEFSTTESGLTYPSLLDETIEHNHKPWEEIDGYGGIYIKISDFSVN